MSSEYLGFCEGFFSSFPSYVLLVSSRQLFTAALIVLLHPGEIRLLGCSVDSLGMLVSDMKTLLTVSDWMEGAALFTQDQNLIRIAKNYFDQPFVLHTRRHGQKKLTLDVSVDSTLLSTNRGFPVL